MLVRAMSNWLHTNSVGLGVCMDLDILGQFFFSSKDTKTVHCNTFIKHALWWTKRKVSFGQNPPGNSKIRRKSADFSYSHKKTSIRDAFTDWLASSLIRFSSDAAFLICLRIRRDLVPLREESRSRKQFFRSFGVNMWHHIWKRQKLVLLWAGGPSGSAQKMNEDGFILTVVSNRLACGSISRQKLNNVILV